MRLHVCSGTFQTPTPGGNAWDTLREAGRTPEAVRTFGCVPLRAIIAWPAANPASVE